MSQLDKYTLPIEQKRELIKSTGITLGSMMQGYVYNYYQKTDGVNKNLFFHEYLDAVAVGWLMLIDYVIDIVVKSPGYNHHTLNEQLAKLQLTVNDIFKEKISVNLKTTELKQEAIPTEGDIDESKPKRRGRPPIKRNPELAAQKQEELPPVPQESGNDSTPGESIEPIETPTDDGDSEPDNLIEKDS